jgi:hypothetical protein
MNIIRDLEGLPFLRGNRYPIGFPINFWTGDFTRHGSMLIGSRFLWFNGFYHLTG